MKRLIILLLGILTINTFSQTKLSCPIKITVEFTFIDEQDLVLGEYNLSDKDIQEFKCLLSFYNSSGKPALSYISKTNSAYFISNRGIPANNNEVEYSNIDDFEGAVKCKVKLIYVKFEDGTIWKPDPKKKVVFESQ